jgi:transcriptional regulator with XRE-family HTH domain
MRSRDEKIFLVKMGERIVEIRKAKNISQVELGDRCDIEKPNMRRIEAGKTNMTTLTMRKICRALNIHLKDLMDFDE